MIEYLGIRSDRQRFEKKLVVLPDGCWKWVASMMARGYGQFSFDGKWTLAHRVSWILYRGSIPDDMLVLHKCNNTSCVNPDHLYIGTQYENVMDSIRAGDHSVVKLNEFDVACIKRMLRDKISQWLIAWTYKVTQPTISRISTSKRWAHVTI